MDLGKSKLLVSTHSRLKAAGKMYYIDNNLAVVSTHSRLKAAGGVRGTRPPAPTVSTHSRLKAAGKPKRKCKRRAWFQHTAA